MVREMSQERRLSNAWLSADLDQHAGVDRGDGGRHLDSAIDQSSEQAGAEEDRSGPGVQVRPLGSHGFAERGTVRLANLQEEPANRNPPDDRFG
jgi:hypothetical protein